MYIDIPETVLHVHYWVFQIVQFFLSLFPFKSVSPVNHAKYEKEKSPEARFSNSPKLMFDGDGNA